VGRGKGCGRQNCSGGGSPASCDADGRGADSAAQRTSNRAARWQSDGRRNRSRRAGTITRGSSRARSTPVVASRGRRAQLGEVGGGRGAGTVRAL